MRSTIITTVLCLAASTLAAPVPQGTVTWGPELGRSPNGYIYPNGGPPPYSNQPYYPDRDQPPYYPDRGQPYYPDRGQPYYPNSPNGRGNGGSTPFYLTNGLGGSWERLEDGTQIFRNGQGCISFGPDGTSASGPMGAVAKGPGGAGMAGPLGQLVSGRPPQPCRQVTTNDK
jgi:hypothetical protein